MRIASHSLHGNLPYSRPRYIRWAPICSFSERVTFIVLQTTSRSLHSNLLHSITFVASQLAPVITLIHPALHRVIFVAYFRCMLFTQPPQRQFHCQKSYWYQWAPQHLKREDFLVLSQSRVIRVILNIIFFVNKSY